MMAMLMMRMLMMRIRIMCMRVSYGRMPMGMRVARLQRHHGLMRVIVMQIIRAMHVFMGMFERFVDVFMRMVFREMQRNADRHQRAPEQQRQRERLVQ